MKKYILLMATLPTLATAHTSNSEPVRHAVEHQLNNPFMALALFLGIAVSVHLVRKAIKLVK